MVRETVATLALLKVLHERKGFDYLDVFLPLLLDVLATEQYSSIGRNEVFALSEKFYERYGIRVPQYSIQAILERARKRGHLSRDHQQFHFNAATFDASSFRALSARQFQRIEGVVNKLVAFSADTLSDAIDAEQAERALIVYLRRRGVEILVSASAADSLPEVDEKDSDEYRVARFIQHCYESDYPAYLAVVDMSLGYVLARAIAQPPDEMRPFQAGLRGNHVYLDTPLLLDLLGSHGPEARAAMAEFVKVLHVHGVEMLVLDHVLNELTNILQDCVYGLESGNSDEDKMSPACRYYYRTGTPTHEVVELIDEVEKRLADHRIAVVPGPDPNTNQRFEIGVQALEDKIIEVYGADKAEYHVSAAAQRRIRRDVASIAAIYKLRENREPLSIRQAKYIFVTGNFTLAFADRQFAKESLDYRHGVSACQTAETVCTVLWLQSPVEMGALNAKRLIADAYAAMEPDERLVAMFLSEVSRLEAKGDITPEQAFVLKGSLAAIDLLRVSTLNDPERFTARTPDQVLSDLLDEKRRDAEALIGAAAAEHELELGAMDRENAKLREALVKKAEELDTERQTRLRTQERIRTVSANVSGFAGATVLVLTVVWLILGFLVAEYSLSGGAIGDAAAASYKIAGVIGVVVGGSLVALRKRLDSWLNNALCRYFRIDPNE